MSHTLLFVWSQHTVYPGSVSVVVHVSTTGVPCPGAPLAGPVLVSGAGAATVNVRHPPVASVVPVPFCARTCHSYVAPAVSPVTVAVVALPTLCHVAEQLLFSVVSRQYA